MSSWQNVCWPFPDLNKSISIFHLERTYFHFFSLFSKPFSLLLHLVRVGLGPLPPTCCWKSKWMIGESDSPSHFPTSSNHSFLTIPRWLFQIILSVTHLLNSLSPLFVQALCQLAVRCVYLIQDIIKNQVLLLPSDNLRKIKFYLYQVATWEKEGKGIMKSRKLRKAVRSHFILCILCATALCQGSVPSRCIFQMWTISCHF